VDLFLRNQTALVTGGTRGIGYAIAEALASNGASVVICGTTEGGVSRAVETLRTGVNSKSSSSGIKVDGKVVDVRDEARVEALFEFVDASFGGLDILINNAGLGTFRSVAEMTTDEWKRTLETNLNGVFYCSRAALRRFRTRGGGAIVNISSLAAKNAFAGGAAYNASKFGLNGFSEAMMLDHRYENVRVSSIMPGSVDTDFSPRSGRSHWKIAPEDVAQAVLAVLRMPERTLISRVEMRPLKPGK
jgi:3-oxoacyl-[acyl-carrier protein] reductase